MDTWGIIGFVEPNRMFIDIYDASWSEDEYSEEDPYEDSDEDQMNTQRRIRKRMREETLMRFGSGCRFHARSLT